MLPKQIRKALTNQLVTGGHGESLQDATRRWLAERVPGAWEGAEPSQDVVRRQVIAHAERVRSERPNATVTVVENEGSFEVDIVEQVTGHISHSVWKVGLPDDLATRLSVAKPGV